MRKTTRHSGPAVRDHYMELIRRFPLKVIRNDREHARAEEMVSELIGRHLDAESGDYLDALLLLVNKYEDEHPVIDSNMTPRRALRALMKFNDLSQADIGRIIGSESAVSMFLKGSRGLSQAQIKALCTRFKVDALLFMP